MTRGGRIGGGGRKRRGGWYKGGVPTRPLRWISGADGTSTDNPCVTLLHPIVCNSSEGPTAFELVQGSSDLEVVDRQEVTVTRVVGQLSLFYSQYVVIDSPSYSIPFVRMGLLTVESAITVGTWVPPDLFDDAELEETSFMWLRQECFSEDIIQLGPLDVPGIGNPIILESRLNVEVDCGINRKIGRDGHLMLVMQAHYGAVPVPDTSPLQPLVGFNSFLRVLVKC